MQQPERAGLRLRSRPLRGRSPRLKDEFESMRLEQRTLDAVDLLRQHVAHVFGVDQLLQIRRDIGHGMARVPAASAKSCPFCSEAA